MNVLYLVLKNLLDSPILYLSSYIIQNKDEYYRLLQAVREKGEWEDWIVYMLKGVEQTAVQTLRMVKQIHDAIDQMTVEIKASLPKIYSRELIELLFYEFYTKTQYMQNGLGVTRKTAAGYLHALEREGFLVSQQIGKERVYQNKLLFDLIRDSEQS